MAEATTTYDPKFYDSIRAGTRASADVIVPLVYDLIRPRRVIDVGCGEGWWASTFEHSYGCEVLGIDGTACTEEGPLGRRHRVVNLGEPINTNLLGRHDLAVCLEVAEHLPPERARGFVADLCKLAPVVLFSAAIPGQGGHGHVNEAWPRYWADLFRARQYACSAALRWRIWDDERVENWYRQNLLLFARHPEEYPTLFDSPLAEPFPVVHPFLWDWRRSW